MNSPALFCRSLIGRGLLNPGTRTCILALVLLGAAPLAGCRSNTPAPDHRLTVVSDQWPPYSLPPGSNPPGFTLELLRAIYAPCGVEVVYREVPFETALAATLSGKYDAVLNGGTRDLQGCLLPGEPSLRVHFAAFVRRDDNWRYSGPKSLLGRTVGVVRGYQYDQGGPLDTWLGEHPARVHALSGRSPLADLQALLQKGRVDVVLDDARAFAWVAENRRQSREFQAAGEIGSLALHIGFSPARPAAQYHADRFTRGMREMRNNGALARLLQRYGLTDWQEAPQPAPAAMQK